MRKEVKQNKTVAWQERERAYLTELCKEKGRENLSLSEYKAAMQEVKVLEQQAKVLGRQNEGLEQHKKNLEQVTDKLYWQVQEIEVYN